MCDGNCSPTSLILGIFSATEINFNNFIHSVLNFPELHVLQLALLSLCMLRERIVKQFEAGYKTNDICFDVTHDRTGPSDGNPQEAAHITEKHKTH